MSKIKKRIFIGIVILVTIGFGLLGYFVFKDSYLRLIEGFYDLFNSIKYYFCELFDLNKDITVTVEDYSKVLNVETEKPESSEVIAKDTVSFFELFISESNFKGWLKKTLMGIAMFSRVLVVLIPILLIFTMVIVKVYKTPNNDYNEDTVPLKVFKKMSAIIYEPVKALALDFLGFLKTYRWIPIMWLAVWVLHLNLASIIVEFFAYYFFFAMSYKFSTIYIQFVKLFLDLSVLFDTIPIWLFLVLFYPIFNHWRIKIALDRLDHMEKKNRGFINELPIVSMTCGSMGKKKTTIITDMALSQEVMFRNTAFEKLQKLDMAFPNFPWIMFELEIRKCMEYGTIYNLATIKRWIDLKEQRFNKHKDSNIQLYGYDFEKYGFTYNDNLKEVGLFEVLRNYAQLYFIYVIESSLIVSNYSIREDNKLISEGNFPLWNSNFFPKKTAITSRHAHILDYDVLRLGRKVLDKNPNIGSFEFGVVVISEVGKERGNNLELKEVKKGTLETNQKNDLFNSWLKMCRHSATVENFPFIKVFTDEQRPESWGADARDLCDIVNIVSSSEQKLALPLYILEEWLNESIFNRFIGFYYDMRYIRGDNTLLVYLLKKIVAVVYKYNARIYNQYGYSISNVEKERGTLDSKIDKKKYYIMNKKIYSKRFSTDCFSDYFNDLAKNTHLGLPDYVEYLTEKASIDELKQQNSYFINSLYKDKEEVM